MKSTVLARGAARIVFAGSIAVATLVSVGASPASAGYHSGPCRTGDICYYQANYLTGSQVGIPQYEVDDVENPWVAFQTAGTGQGQGIGNNAGSIQNLDTLGGWTVFEDEYYRGRTNVVVKYGSLTGSFVTRNNNRSHTYFFS